MGNDEPFTYRKNFYYINTIAGEYRREKMVSMLSFYVTWFCWFLFMPHYKKYKNFNVLYQEDCSREVDKEI